MKLRMILTLACTLFMMNANAMVKVIYGNDDRRDIFDVTNPLYLKLAKSTAAHVATGNITTVRGDATKVNINGATLVSRGYCADDPFTKQQAAARCSGFLVGKDLMVTAGHCIRGESDCSGYKFVFDYAVTDPNQDVTNFVHPVSKVYSCVEIIERELDGRGADYALIRLDREVTDREPLTVRKTGKVIDGTPLVVIGHPTGLPTKVADGAIVRDNSFDGYFQSNLDTFGGNSGSAVFDADSGQVEGILVRGERDYRYDSTRGCTTNNQCADDGCRGEDVTRITEIKALQN